MVEPAVTVTEAGTTAAASLLDRVTIASPGGAGAFNVTLFNVLELPPISVAGESVTDRGVTGFTVKFALVVTPLLLAEIATTVMEETVDVAIVNNGETV